MKDNKIRVVVKEVNKPCEVREIANDYKAFQHIVDVGIQNPVNARS